MPRRGSRPRRRIARVLLRLGGRESRIESGPGLLDAVGDRLAARCEPGPVAVVSSARIFGLHGPKLLRSLRRAGFAPASIRVPDGERAKSLVVAARLYRDFLHAGLDRSSPVVALGGGVVGDLAGFAAATYMRGVPLVMVPTTLLAQVDSSIGGKTAVNLSEGKNLVGAFHQPILVLADTTTLRTLPAREFRAGLAEVVKVAAALDGSLFRQLEEDAEAILLRDESTVARIVARAAAWKARIVAADARDESGRRALLNYGHTIGHALEAAARYRTIRHGEAVAIGIVAAARIAVALGVLSAAAAARQESLIARFGLPTRIPAGLAIDDLLGAIGRDKKALRGRPVLVLTPRVGSASLHQLSSTRVVARVLRELGRGRRGGVR